MGNRIVITEYESKYLILFIKDDIPVKIRCLNTFDEATGTVYLGRVQNVKKNINSSFVKFNGKTGFIDNCERKPETVFPVMVKKETASNKEDEITDNISLTGLYTIVSSELKGLHFSKKLNNKYKDNFDKTDFENVIIRHNAENADYDSIKNEYILLSSKLKHITEISSTRTDNSILYNGIPKVLNYIFNEKIEEYEEILTDSDDIKNLLAVFVANYNVHNISFPIKILKYEDKLVPLSALISLSSKLSRATDRKVYLKSDAYIIIDTTEAMTVIDVNSGNTTYKGNKQEVIHNINTEAAKEICLQLKLRNISGIIVVDFINVNNKEKNNELLDFIKNELKNDDQHAKCHGMTKLGLVEITRNRTEKSLKEQLWK